MHFKMSANTEIRVFILKAQSYCFYIFHAAQRLGGTGFHLEKQLLS